MKIKFWLDDEKTKVDPKLFSEKAEDLARDLADDHKEIREKPNKRTQLRKFYDEVHRLNTLAKTSQDKWDFVLPQVHMLVAKAAYAQGRKLVSPNFKEFIVESVKQVQVAKDLSVFSHFFEAFMGFYRLYGPNN